MLVTIRVFVKEVMAVAKKCKGKKAKPKKQMGPIVTGKKKGK